MSGYGPAGAHYLRETVETASPAVRLVMLYDRLVTDLLRAQAMLEADDIDIETTNSTLQHAQEIVSLLDATLDVAIWPAGENLRSLYQWVWKLLLTANLTKEAGPVREALEVIEPLRNTWRQAALITAGAHGPAVVSVA